MPSRAPTPNASNTAVPPIISNVVFPLRASTTMFVKITHFFSVFQCSLHAEVSERELSALERAQADREQHRRAVESLERQHCEKIARMRQETELTINKVRVFLIVFPLCFSAPFTPSFKYRQDFQEKIAQVPLLFRMSCTIFNNVSTGAPLYPTRVDSKCRDMTKVRVWTCTRRSVATF